MLEQITSNEYVIKGVSYAHEAYSFILSTFDGFRILFLGAFMKGGIYAGALIIVALLGLGFAVWKLVEGIDNSDNNDGIIAIIFIMTIVGVGIAFIAFGKGV